MRELTHYPKIWALGTKQAQGIFDQEVEITEKLDGSQFGFGYVDEQLIVRSKGTYIDYDNVPDLFQLAVNHVLESQVLLHPNYHYYSETLCRPRHNTLQYNSVPLNNIALYAIYDTELMDWLSYDDIQEEAKRISVDVVPLIYRGKSSEDEVKKYINQESCLGGADAEGVVIKAFKEFMLFGSAQQVQSAKFVTEKFKERHGQNKEFKSGKSLTQELFAQYNSEARWTKAVQKLKESGDFLGEPKDIGKLIKILHLDLDEECQEEIKDELWKIHRKEFIGSAVRGFPEWYKSNLSQFVE